MKQLETLLRYKPLKMVLDALCAHTRVYLVGGAVRDLLMDQPISDIDLACALHAEVLSRILTADQGFKIVPTGIAHGTVLVVVENESIEITTFRAPSGRYDTKYSETIEEDLAGRDFTINAMAVDTVSGDLIDPFHGQSDLNDRIVRCVGDAALRFREDPLRILRAIRFGSANGFVINVDTENALMVSAKLLLQVSIERVREELSKILISPYPAEGFRSLLQYGLMEYTLPEIIRTVGCEQNKWHTQDVFEHTLTVIERTPPELLLRLVALFHDVGKPDTLSVGDDGERHFYGHEYISADICRVAMRRLKYSNELVDKTARLVSYHMRPLVCSSATVRRLMRDLGPLLDDWRKFKWADKSPTISEEQFQVEASEFDRNLSGERSRQDYVNRTQLAINGHQIMELFNLAPGPQLGKILSDLKEIILDDPNLNTPTELVKLVEQIISTTYQKGTSSD
jgi:tRNA nucleotidyltransferase (CCA-adding enzyme)